LDTFLNFGAIGAEAGCWWHISFKRLAPVKPGPDFSGEGDQGEGVFEFESPLGGFVAEEVHAQQAAGPAANGTEQDKEGFRYARAGA
jgi:hypothetical protein